MKIVPITGWIIYNRYLQSDKFLEYATMLGEAATERGHHISILTNEDIVTTLQTEKLSLFPKPDYVLFTDKDIYLARFLENNDVRVFNRATTIEICDDKIKTYECLAKLQLPIPKTIVAPKTFQQNTKLTEQFLSKVESELSFPYIVKENFGSFGEQVHLIHSLDEMKEKLNDLSEPFMFQEFIKTSTGVDIRLQVVGEEVVAAMKRTARHDFRANVTAGGTMEPYNPSELEKKIAVEATKAVGADFAGVDLLLGPDNSSLICEVNSNAHIQNLLDCTGINAAEYIVEYVEKVFEENLD